VGEEMLVLSRKKNESIVIDGNIEIKIVGMDGDTVKIGIEAPRHVEIHRKEIYVSIQSENEMASKGAASLDDLKKIIRPVRESDSE
jgi:carbon storage regulator